MKKINIIKENTDYEKIINSKNRIFNQHFSIYYQPSDKYNHYGITVPKKNSIAVIRNKIKRRIKNIIDKNEISIPKYYDYVIIVRREAKSLPYQELEESFLNLIKKIKEKK